MSPRGVPKAKEETKPVTEVHTEEKIEDARKAVDSPKEHMDNLERFVREVVTAAVSPYTERISTLEQQVEDLNNVVGAPQDAVQFYTPDPEHPQGDPDADVPWFNPQR